MNAARRIASAALSTGRPGVLAAVLAAMALAGAAACGGADRPGGPGDGRDSTGTLPPTPIPKAIPIAFGSTTVLQAELATTRAQRETGLMNRPALGADSGMVFVWPGDQQYQLVAFYMRNTHFDLSVAFLDGSKRVINVEDMARDTETLHFATAPFRYAIEAPLGWFRARGIGAGTTAAFTIPPGATIEP